MSFAVASSAAACSAFSAKKASSIRGNKKATAALRPVTATTAARRAMSTVVKASSVNLLQDGDKKPLVDSVETFIFDCDGVIWKGDSLIEARDGEVYR
jgi:phosphoglycolate phosphatase